jgi:hypothetical protein
MPKQKSKSSAAWQHRREEYLRESGRHIDLINEGYKGCVLSTDWIVVVGHRKSHCQESCPTRKLVLVNGQTQSSPENTPRSASATS